MVASDRNSLRRLIAVEQLVLARYEIAEASVLDPTVAGRLRRMRMQRRGGVSDLLALVDGCECTCDGLVVTDGGTCMASQETALALLRLAEERAVSIYDEALAEGLIYSHHEAFARRILDAQRAIQWFDRLAASLGRAPLA